VPPSLALLMPVAQEQVKKPGRGVYP
jgi:hypothetical protein